MVRIASIKQIGTKTGGTITAGPALGASGPSAGTTSTANNVYVRPGASINQIAGPSVTPIAGISGVRYTAAATTSTAESSAGTSGSNYKLSVASMLLALKNQALGSLSLGGSKAGGSITENISGVNLG